MTSTLAHRERGKCFSSSGTFVRIVVVSLVFLLRIESGRADEPSADRPESVRNVGATAQNPPSAQARLKPWLTSMARGHDEAQRRGQPILVRVGADWCPWCRKLVEEIGRAEVQHELGRWILVELDVDKDESGARALGVGPIPALRVLSAAGRVVASHDGFMTAHELIDWLERNHDQASGAPIEELTEAEELSAVALIRLVRQFDQPDPVVREACFRRLQARPDLAASAVVDAFAQGSLQTRLAALELLEVWHAPVSGIDPWVPGTVTDARLKDLRTWAGQAAKPPGVEPLLPTPEQLAEARIEIDKLLIVPQADAAAIRERIARWGRALLPQVYDRLKRADTDQARQRLTALRYRLVASDALALRWPGGLDRLAAIDVAARHQAVDELVQRSNTGDEGLLLELFSDPDPLVRETALRGLNALGGGTAGALIGLLADPEPNVRAAVLKQLAERPSTGLQTALADYVAKETDPDLVVHAVRVLRALPNRKGLKVLIDLLEHESWRVRAEAAEAIGKQVEQSDRQADEATADAYAALIERLDDADGFVVGRVLTALERTDLLVAVEPLARAAEKHPELASQALRKLAKRPEMRAKAMPHFRKFASHPRPDVRAAATEALGDPAARSLEPEVLAALNDSESVVRCNAATVVFAKLKQMRPSEEVPGALSVGDVPDVQPTLVGRLIGSLLGGRPAAKPGPEEEAKATQEARDRAPGKEPSPGDQEHPIDAWLERFQGELHRPKWVEPAIGPLGAMLSAQPAEERLAAALPLLALGRDKDALPVLLSVARERPDLAGQCAEALPWRRWSDRLALFQQLLAIGLDTEQLADLAEHLAEVRDRRAAEPLWSMATPPDLKPEVASAVVSALRKLHFGNGYYDLSSISNAERKHVAAESRKKAETGPEWQRAIGLALLLSVAPDAAAEVASAIVDDAKATVSLRRDALQILLLARDRAAGRTAAVAALEKGEPELKQIALLFLTSGPDHLSTLHDQIYLMFDQQALAVMGSSPTAPAIPKIPSELKPVTLRPLLHTDKAELAALAGYVLVLLDEADGVDPLLTYWHDPTHRDQAWNQRVYQAIAHLGDDAKVPLLEQIYTAALAEGKANRYGVTTEIRDFYWTIRSMDGPNAQKLRKRIRQDVGMPYLRGESNSLE